MLTVAVFTAVLDTLKVLGSAIASKHALGEEKRQKLATLCDQISGVLTKFIQAPENHRQEIHLCAELREYVEPLRNIASGTILTQEINRLASALNTVCDAWGKLAEEARSSGHASEPYLDQLEEGAGKFSGFANRLRAT